MNLMCPTPSPNFSKKGTCYPVLRAQLTGGLSLPPEGDFFQLLFNFFELILRRNEIGRVVGRLGLRLGLVPAIVIAASGKLSSPGKPSL